MPDIPTAQEQGAMALENDRLEQERKEELSIKNRRLWHNDFFKKVKPGSLVGILLREDYALNILPGTNGFQISSIDSQRIQGGKYQEFHATYLGHKPNQEGQPIEVYMINTNRKGLIPKSCIEKIVAYDKPKTYRFK